MREIEREGLVRLRTLNTSNLISCPICSRDLSGFSTHVKSIPSNVQLSVSIISGSAVL